jgi:histone H3/H4
MAELPNAPVKRLLIEGSHGCRVSASALDLAAEHAANIVRRLGEAAAKHAIVDKRKTIMDQDIARAWTELTG